MVNLNVSYIVLYIDRYRYYKLTFLSEKADG